MSPGRAFTRRTLGQGRTVTISFAVGFTLYAVANVVGYRSTYPTLADRRGLQESFATTSSLRLFYGEETLHHLEDLEQRHPHAVTKLS